MLMIAQAMRESGAGSTQRSSSRKSVVSTGVLYAVQVLDKLLRHDMPSILDDAGAELR